MKTKTISWIFAMVLLAALLSSNAFALGMVPGRTVLNLEPDKTEKATFTIMNNENRDMKVLIYSDDENAEFLDIKPTVIELKSNEPSKDFTFSFKIPDKVLKPGMNEIKIKAMELPEGYGEEGKAKITATIELIHQLRINVPYSGKYAESDVYITSDDPDKPILFTIPVFNRGKERINSAKATIEIYDVNGNLVAAVETNEISLGPGKEGKVTAQVHTKLGRGRYKAIVHLSYDEKSIDMEKEFFVAVPLIGINAVTVDSSFRLGGIAKFTILLENTWNQKIDNIYGDIKISDQNNREIGRFKTASTDIDANAIGILDAYWDTKDVNPGLYRMHIALNYLNLMNERVFDMDVGFDSINIREYGATAAVVASEGGGISRNLLLGTAVFILVVLNIAVVIYFKKNIYKKH